jgi:RND family efflux transporter MFP subunit
VTTAHRMSNSVNLARLLFLLPFLCGVWGCQNNSLDSDKADTADKAATATKSDKPVGDRAEARSEVSAASGEDPGKDAGKDAGKDSDKDGGKDGEKEEERKPLPLKMCVTQTADVKKVVVIPGTVTALPDHSVKISPAMSGKLVAVLVEPGQQVARHQLIARLDDRHIKDQIEQANVAVQTAKTGIAQAENNVAFAKDNLERTRKLFTAEVLAKKEIMTAENQLQSAQAALETIKAQVRAAQTNTKQFETELSFTEVHSTIDGVVANRYLNTGDTADLTTPIVQIVQLQTVLVNAALPADSPERLRVGQHAQIKSVAHEDDVFDGVIKSISPVVDTATNTIRVQLQCQNRGDALRESQAVSVSITNSMDRAKILVPATALVPDPENPAKEMVYVVKNGKASRVSVVKGTSEGDNVEILSGLAPGQTIIAQGAYGLPNDSPVVRAETK